MIPEPNTVVPCALIHELMTAKDIHALGIGRDRARAIMNRTDLPVITLGRRKYSRREKFFAWLDAQANASLDGMEGC